MNVCSGWVIHTDILLGCKYVIDDYTIQNCFLTFNPINMFSINEEPKKRKPIDKYLEISDRLNAPIMIEDGTVIKPFEEPYTFIQPQNIDLTEFDTDEEITIQLSNSGAGFLIISSVSADVDWIKIDNNGDKKVLEWSDEPFPLKIRIERDKLPAGEHNGTITIQTIQDAKTLHQIPIHICIPKEDAALIVPSTDVLNFGSIPLHKEFEFNFAGEADQIVYLQGDFTNWELGRITMNRVEDNFRAIIPLEDGEYLYQFSVDGRELPDPNNQQRIVIGEHGNCSKLSLNRYRRDFTLTNVGTKSLKVKLTVPEGISLSEYEFWLEKREKKSITIFLLPSKMNPGINIFNIDIEVKSRQVGSIKGQVNGIAYGPVADVSHLDFALGTVFRGSKIVGSLNVKNSGNGIVTGNIIVEVPWLGPDRFEVPEGEEKEIIIPVDAERLSPGEYKTIVTLITNDCIHGRNRYNIPISFQLVSVDVKPGEIDFGVMWVDEPKEQNVRARRSDGARMELELPLGLPSWLDASLSGRQTLNVKLNWNKIFLESDRDLEATINLTDKRSSLQEPVTVRGRILIPHIAVDEINFGGGNWKKKTLPLTIRNMGNGKLVIRKIEISSEQQWMSLKYKKRRSNIPEFYVSVNRRLIPKLERSIPITGVIRIHSNDPIEPILDVFVIIDAEQP